MFLLLLLTVSHFLLTVAHPLQDIQLSPASQWTSDNATSTTSCSMWRNKRAKRVLAAPNATVGGCVPSKPEPGRSTLTSPVSPPPQTIQRQEFMAKTRNDDFGGRVVQLNVTTRHQLQLGYVYRLKINIDQVMISVVAEQEYLVPANGVWWTLAHDVYTRHRVISREVEFDFEAEHTDALKVQLHFLRRVTRVQGHWSLIRIGRKLSSSSSSTSTDHS